MWVIKINNKRLTFKRRIFFGQSLKQNYLTMPAIHQDKKCLYFFSIKIILSNKIYIPDFISINQTTAKIVDVGRVGFKKKWTLLGRQKVGTAISLKYFRSVETSMTSFKFYELFHYFWYQILNSSDRNKTFLVRAEKCFMLYFVDLC